MDEIGDEFSDKPENDKSGEELLELINESDEPDEFDDIIPEVFSEPDEFDDDIPEVFSEPDEFDDDFLDDAIHDKEDSERADEDRDSGDVGNVIENENIGSQSTSTVLTNEIEEIESNMEHQEQEEEEIEIRPEECQDTEPIVNTDESEFIKDVEELAEYTRELKAEDEVVESQVEKENAAYYAEQYYETLKEKEVVNEQDSKEEQEAEELRQEVTEELNSDQESGYKSEEVAEENISEGSKEITSTEEFEYLWEVRDKLDREGKPPEEIEEVMHEAEEMYETLKNAEKLYEEQELEKLKLVDHKDEATEEDLKEDLDRVDLVEQAVELEEKLFQQGESQEEIDVRVEEAIEKTIETVEFEEKLEEIIEKQELEKLKLVDHEDEEDIDDAREEIDRPAETEYYMEVEEELHRQGMSQEEIDEQMEEITSNYQNEIKKKQEKEEEDLNVSEELEKQNSSAEQCDQIKLTSALSSEKKEESDEEENEHLQELYRRETGRRPIYARQKSKGYSQWLEQRELRSEKINNSKSESEKKKEIEEEGWKTTLKQWLKEASEEECNAELKFELKKALECYNEFEYLIRKFLELYKKAQYEKLTEIEKNRLKFLTERLQGLGPIQLELLANIRAFKDYFYNHLWELMNRFFVNRVRSKFFKHISQKYKELRKEQKNEKNKYLINKNNCSMKKSFLESENLEFVENQSNIDFNFKKSFPIKISSTLDSPQSTLDKYLPPEVQKYLVPIVDQVISDYMQRVNENRRLLPEYDPSIPISKFVVDLSSLDSTLVRDIISRKGKIRYQWWGFTYEWEDLWTGVTMTGKTTRPHPSRYWEYVLKSIYSGFNVVSLNIKIRNHFYKSINNHLKYDILNIKDELKTDLTKDILKQIKVNGLIFHHLILENVLTHTITGEIDFDSIDFSSVKKSINNRFLFKFLKLTFSNNALSQCEIERILYQRNIGIALNRDKKSLGSSSAYNILNNTIFRLVAIGFTKPQITNFLNEIGYKVDLVLINTLLTDFFDGIQNAREIFLNPVIDRFFALGMFKHYLDEIFDYFERGYSSIQISTLCGVNKIFLNSPEIIRCIVIKKYSPIYNGCSSFEQLRQRHLKNLFKDKISECVNKGIVNYAILLDRFDGLKNLPNDKVELKRIQDFFREIFGSNLTDFVVNKYNQDGFNSIKPDKIKNKIYKFNKYLDLFNKEELLKDALKLIKKNIWEKLNTEYSARQLCIDLNFVRFGYSNNAFLQKGKELIEKFTGTSFNDLIIQALDLQDKAIKLVCDNINEITVTSGFTGYTGLNLLIDLNLDRFLSIDSLINNRDRYIRKFIGFSSWQELLNFVKENYFKNQEVLNWEINFQHFFNFYKINPNKSSKMYFEKFPKVSENTIYRWIKKSKDILKK